MGAYLSLIVLNLAATTSYGYSKKNIMRTTRSACIATISYSPMKIFRIASNTTDEASPNTKATVAQSIERGCNQVHLVHTFLIK